MHTAKICCLLMIYRECQKNGIWAWDHVYDEAVLVIPSILALLGDNPMQSEFASHIGMQGKCFCRRCKVKGSDAKNCAEGEEGERERVHDFLNVRVFTTNIHQETLLIFAFRSPRKLESKETPSCGSMRNSRVHLRVL